MVLFPIEHPVDHFSVCFVHFPPVEIDVYIRGGVSAMPQSGRDSLLRNIQRCGYGGPGMARPIGGDVREKGVISLLILLRMRLAPILHPLHRADLFQSGIHPSPKIPMIRIPVSEVQQVFRTFVLVDDGLGFRFDPKYCTGDEFWPGDIRSARSAFRSMPSGRPC